MKAKKVKDVLEGGPAMVSGLPKLLPKEGGDESVLDRADRIKNEDDVKFIEVREGMDFERGRDPKDAMDIGNDRFKQPRDMEFGNRFYWRELGDEPAALIVNAENGNEYRVSFYAAKEVRQALETLI